MNAQPIIPWIGGKRRLADRLIPLFPQHTCYVEVFCGGAALFFLRPQPVDVEVLNDINGDLVCLYRVVQHHLEEFVRQFKWALSSRKIFEWQQITRPETLTDIQRAARFFYLQQLAFGGKVAGQNFGTATTAPPGLNLLRLEETLSAAHLRLASAYVENLIWGSAVGCCAQGFDVAPAGFQRLHHPFSTAHHSPPALAAHMRLAGLSFPARNFWIVSAVGQAVALFHPITPPNSS